MHRLCDYKNAFRILKGGKISLVVSAFLTTATLVHASPTGGNVTSGSANISQSGNTTTINQSTNKASINWQKFDIAPSETVNFVQPNSNSVTLNRVVGTSNSLIQGAMNANGQVILVNPNGVVFTEGSTVNVGGLVATTKNITDENFQNGNYKFEGDSNASILNKGTINAKYVAMMGKTVQNEGTITATLGRVELAGGNKFTLNLNGDSLLKLTIDEGTLNALVENKGIIKADGGVVHLTTQALNSILDGVVNNTGVIEAQSLSTNENGEVVLFAHGGTTNVSGEIKAEKGFVETSGEILNIEKNVKVSSKDWLLDPANITISTATTSGMNGFSAFSGNWTSVLNVNTLTSSLNAGTNVTVTTTNSGIAGGSAGDITVASAINWSGASTLTLHADRNIHINADITASNANGKVALEYGQGAVATNNTATYDFGLTSSGFTGKINLQSGQNFSTKLGSDGAITNWTVITALGSAGDESSNVANSLQSLAYSGNLNGNYVLGANINALDTLNWNGNSGWTPIGSSSAKFLGKFDGLGHTVDGLFVDNSSQGIGFFGKTDVQRDINTGNPISDTLIRNIGITNAVINPYPSNSTRVGVLVGELVFSTVKNAYTSGSVRGKDRVGGLIGYAQDSDISGSYTTGGVKGIYNVGGLVGYALDSTIDTSYHSNGIITGLLDNGSNGDSIGGLVGYAGYVGANSGTTTITNSYNTGVVRGDSYNIGGLIGTAFGVTNISSSYATGSVSGVYDVGGLIGYSRNTNISDTYATGSVTASGNAQTQWAKAGGLIGYMNEGTTSQSYATGNVSTSSLYDIVGGFIGYNLKGTITKSYATGTVNGGYSIGGFAGTNEYGLIENVYAIGNATGTYYVGGLVGDNGNGSSNNITLASIIRNSYAYNTVTATGTGSSTTVGGITSLNSGTISNSYYDKTLNTATMVDPLAGKTTAEMSDILTYRGSNPNNPVWSIAAANVSNPYPTLRWTTGLTGTSAWVMPYKQQVTTSEFDFNTLFTNNSATASNGSTLSLSGGQLTATFNASPVILTQSQTNAGYITDDFVAINAAKVANTSGDMTLVNGFTWNGYDLILSSHGDITINSTIAASGATDKLTLEYGQGSFSANNTAIYDFGLTSSTFAGTINLQAGQNFSTKLGSDGVVKNWTVITALGSAGDKSLDVANSLQSLAYSGNLSRNYVLGGDINASGTSTWNNGEGWIPIGAMLDRNTPAIGTFQGSFDGLGHTISGLRSTSTTIDIGVGLFGGTYQATISNLALATPITSLSLANGGGTNPAIGNLIGNSSNSKISNIIVSNATLSVTDANSARAGGLIGRSISDIVDHIYMNNITISSNQYGVGGLIGNASFSTISNSSVSGRVTSTRNGGASAGGLIGYGGAVTVISSTSSANVIATPSGEDVGGLIGYSDSDVRVGPNSSDDYIKTIISLSSATGSVTAGSDHVGGLIGFASYTDISNSHATGAVTSTADQVGGLVGYAEYVSIANSYATGAISGRDDVGGLVGYMTYYTPWGTSSTANLRSTISSSYATGTVMATGDSAGGLVGYAEYTDVSGSHATGSITGRYYVGGLVGYASYTDISTSHAIGIVTGTQEQIGGLVGYAEYTDISGSYATGAVSSTGSGNEIGGLIGYNTNGTVDNSYATGAVSSDGIWGPGFKIGGLIGYSYDHSIITNSYATGNITTAGSFSGGLVGLNEYSSTITNSYATGTVIGKQFVGGLVGKNAYSSTISQSHATGSVTSTDTSGRIGGLIGNNWDSDVTDSYATGTVKGTQYVGGLIGAVNYSSTRSNITNSYATGDVEATMGFAGGLIGLDDLANIERSFASGNVQGKEIVGGLVGYHNGWIVNGANNGGLINKSYATGTVTAVGTGSGRFGGLVGENRGHIRNSFATGTVSSPNYATGGLVGFNAAGASIGATITSSYAANTVISTATTDIGGLVGASDGSGVTNSYFDKTINTGMLDEADYGKTTDEMKVYSTYSSSWDVVIDPSLSNVYPKLRWNTTGLNTGTSVWVMGKKDVNYSISGATTTYGQVYNLPTPTFNGGTPTGTVKIYNSNNIDVTTDAIAGTLNVGTYTVKTILNDSNYNLLSTGNIDGTLVVNKANLNYSVNGATKIYGQAYNLPTPTFNGGTPTGTVEVKVYNSNNVDVTTQAQNGTLGSGIYTVKTLLTDANYAIASSGNTIGNLVIGKKDVNYSLSNEITTYGTGYTLATPSFTGGTPTGTTTVKVYDSNNVDVTTQAQNGTLGAGTYTVKTLLTDANYAIANSGNNDGTLVIGKKDLNYSLSNEITTYGTGYTLATPSFTGGTPTGTTTVKVYDSNNVDVTTQAQNGTLGAGTYTVKTLLTDANYDIANSGNTTGTLVVNKSNTVNYSINGGTITYGQIFTLPTATFSGSSFNGTTTVKVYDANNVDVTSQAIAGTLKVGTYLIKAVLTDDNYAIATNGNSVGTLIVNQNVNVNDIITNIANNTIAPTISTITIPTKSDTINVFDKKAVSSIVNSTSNVDTTKSLGTTNLGLNELIRSVNPSASNVSKDTKLTVVGETAGETKISVIELQDLVAKTGGEIRVALSPDSFVELINGGVTLPKGVSQEFYVVEDKK